MAAIINTRRGAAPQPITGRPAYPEELLKFLPRQDGHPSSPRVRPAERVSADGALGSISSTTWALFYVFLPVSRVANRAFFSQEPLSMPCLNLPASKITDILVLHLLQCSR